MDSDWYLNIFNGCVSSPTSFPNYVVANGKLYRFSKGNSPLTSEFKWKEVVPKEHRETILKNNHSDPTAGHMGIFKTYQSLKLRYYWPGIYDDTAKFVLHTTLGPLSRSKECSRPSRTSTSFP